MAKLSFDFDITAIVKAYNQGIEDMFIAMYDFSDFEEICNINAIDTQDDRETDDI